MLILLANFRRQQDFFAKTAKKSVKNLQIKKIFVPLQSHSGNMRK